MLAALGLVIFVLNQVMSHQGEAGKYFIRFSLWALVVSAIGFFSATWNGSTDYTYATYFVSMFVWLGAFYAIVSVIKWVHGYADVRLIVHYLVAVCVAQCILAFAMEQHAPLKSFVDSFLGSEGFMGKVEERMYGIGCALDVAGSRFSAVLIMIAYQCSQFVKDNSSKLLKLYLAAFFLITIVGCMIGRTTMVGSIIGIIYLVWATGFLQEYGKRLLNILLLTSIIIIPVVVYFYNTNAVAQENIRFAFEGFFSLWEKGQWEVNSNNRLADMVVWPDNLKTWIIGDGFFDNPLLGDPYYIGKGIGSYYMNTDIGYLRFIFYFGMIGLLAIMAYFLQVAQICTSKFPKYTAMFYMILLANYIIWCKVASDLFPAFAIFLALNMEMTSEENVE